MRSSFRFLIVLAGLFGLLAGCSTQNNRIISLTPKRSNVDKELPAGAWGLRKLSPGQYPNMQTAFMDKKGLITAIDRSLKFFINITSFGCKADDPVVLG